MALDFPSSPTVGQKYPVTPTAGIPTYTWDGEKWTTQADAIAGDTYVKKIGDTMSGDLTISKSQPAIRLTKTDIAEASIWGQFNANARWKLVLGDSTTETGADVGSDFQLVSRHDDGTLNVYALRGNRANGLMTVVADPTAALGVATKQYVDGKAPAAATAAEYIANSAPTKMLTPGAIWTAIEKLIPTVTATIALDFGAAIDFQLTLNQAGHTFADPTNLKKGQKGIIFLQQDGTGGRTITTWGAAWRFPGGTKPVLSTAPGLVDVISYFAYGTGTIFCTFNADFR